jgi:hypothetical protein
VIDIFSLAEEVRYRGMIPGIQADSINGRQLLPEQGEFFRIAADSCYVGLFCGQQGRQCPADAGSSTCNDDVFVFQTCHTFFMQNYIGAEGRTLTG